MPIEVESFHAEHLKEIELPERDRPIWAASGDEILKIGGYYEKFGPALTGRVDGNILACGGMVIERPGLGNIWLVPSVHVQTHRKSFHKTVLRLFGKVLDNYSTRRIQASVLKGSAVDVRWIRRLGFRFEGTMAGFGANGEDYDLYALVRRA